MQDTEEISAYDDGWSDAHDWPPSTSLRELPLKEQRTTSADVVERNDMIQ